MIPLTHEASTGTRPYRVWTGEEIALVKSEYGRIPRKRIADQLGRNPREVSNKALRLGLQGQDKYRNRHVHH